MNRISPLKTKYHGLYWDIAEAAARQSQAKRLQVGAVIVAPSGMLSIGWNGTPPGMNNQCEDRSGQSVPFVIHAERNAIDKMTRQGVSTEGAALFCTHAPCLECAKQIHACGIHQVFFKEHYRCDSGLGFLKLMGIDVQHQP